VVQLGFFQQQWREIVGRQLDKAAVSTGWIVFGGTGRETPEYLLIDKQHGQVISTAFVIKLR
jgi:hypothetical protein